MLDTIENLFFETAFSDLSMDQIAGHLQMKKASLYYHFPSKEKMFLDVLDHSYTKYRSAIIHILSDSSTDMPEQIVMFGSKNKNLFSVVSQKGYCKIPSIREAIAERMASLRKEMVVQLVQRFGWSEERARLFLMLLDSISKEYCMNSCEASIDPALFDEIRRIFAL